MERFNAANPPHLIQNPVCTGKVPLSSNAVHHVACDPSLMNDRHGAPSGIILSLSGQIARNHSMRISQEL